MAGSMDDALCVGHSAAKMELIKPQRTMMAIMVQSKRMGTKLMK
jgi:hypothetical protein